MTDRRALKRQYLETRTRAGVYSVRNRVNGRVLVAGSRNAQAAINRHRFELRHGSHGNARLAEDWRAHGETAFAFDVLDLVEFRDEPGFDVEHELEVLVTIWREQLDPDPELDYGRAGGRT